MNRALFGTVRTLGLIEGSSFVLLLAVAMPLKYLAGRPEMVQVVGAAHGALWIAFCAAILVAGWRLRWSLITVGAGLVSSVVPLGPFWFERRLARGARGEIRL